ncbi:haloacid dehalogenase type II [Sulfobacillus thermosulfidooxidans]|uniref:haloacid dehalogenase type II n=1 Tax=Sulfobacillus thermosulfidooxidans TaxID=28034 RepID=UPI0002E09019|nr:haloacid dehalogenase type II [Sulfobacillus thermosulfidooxidans]
MIVVFDAYGTLWDVTQIQRECERFTDPETAQRLLSLWRQKQLEYAFLRTIMHQYVPFDQITHDALVYSLQYFHLSLSGAEQHDLEHAWWHPVAFNDALPTLNALKALSHQPIILSNGTPLMLQEGVKATQMQAVLDEVLSVDLTQHYKPHPEAYNLVVTQFNQAPSQVVFVSSNGWDIAGASHFGFHTIWINRLHLPTEELGIRPKAITSSLSELPATLPTLYRK